MCVCVCVCVCVYVCVFPLRLNYDTIVIYALVSNQISLLDPTTYTEHHTMYLVDPLFVLNKHRT